jgi:hypothetical protein
MDPRGRAGRAVRPDPRRPTSRAETAGHHLRLRLRGRPQQTLDADRHALGIPARPAGRQRYAAGDEGHLTKEVSLRPGATLIAWHHEALHKIPEHLGEVDPLPPDYWPPDRFDVIWTFTHDGGRWRFTQVPQLLLPGDLPYPICASLSTAKS